MKRVIFVTVLSGMSLLLVNCGKNAATNEQATLNSEASETENDDLMVALYEKVKQEGEDASAQADTDGESQDLGAESEGVAPKPSKRNQCVISVVKRFPEVFEVLERCDRAAETAIRLYIKKTLGKDLVFPPGPESSKEDHLALYKIREGISKAGSKAYLKCRNENPVDTAEQSNAYDGVRECLGIKSQKFE